MSRPNTKALAALQAALAAVERARNDGRDYYKQSPNEMLIEVSRHAATQFDRNDHVIAFMQGYSEARIHHDDYKRGE
jgi:hypothetical protein